MRRAFVAVSRAAFNAIYRMSRHGARENAVVFLSRQANEPSYDFAQLAAEFERRGWKTVMHLKKVRARNIVPYAVHVLRELRLLGRCKLAVLDRYDPVVSLLNFECDAPPAATGEERGFMPKNLDFPRKPVVLQIWHAFGAFKKFGHQSVGTLEGHSADFTETYDIHRNYSWVLCSGEGARQAFAEAFSCPPERVVPLVRPEFDELVEARAKRDVERGERTAFRDASGKPDAAHAEFAEQVGSERDAGAERDAARGSQAVNPTIQGRPFTVLMAPTLRKSHESAHPFRDLYGDRERLESGIDAEFVWSFHPLEEKLPAPGNVSSQLLDADLLVTDYSSIVYEAYVLGIPTLFYVPDLASYRLSPGLNADPEQLCPDLCVFDAQDLKDRLRQVAANPASYPEKSFAAFAATGFDPETFGLPGTAASRIADFAIKQAEGR